MYLDDRIEEIKKSCPCKQLVPYCRACDSLIKLELQMHEADIPIDFRAKEFDDIVYPDVQEQKRQILDYVSYLGNNRNSGIGLFLTGSSGLGKSLMAGLLLKNALRQGFSACFRGLDDHFRHVLKVDEENIEKTQTVDFLVLHHVGDEFRPESGSLDTVLLELFGYRRNKLLSTIITSNYTARELGIKFRIPFENIIKERFDTVEFKGKNYLEK